MPFAARLTDFHSCPVPGLPPHIGGPISGPGITTVIIGGLPAAVVGDMATCSGPSDMIIKGSSTVLIGGKPAVRQGDSTAHGGVVAAGCTNVIIGG